MKLDNLRGYDDADKLISTMQVVPISIMGQPVAYASGTYAEMISLEYNEDGSLKTIMRTELGDKDVYSFDANGNFVGFEGTNTSFDNHNSSVFNSFGVVTDSSEYGTVDIKLDDYNNPVGTIPKMEPSVRINIVQFMGMMN